MSKDLVSRNAVAIESENYAIVIDNERHHEHPMIIDDDLSYRWKPIPTINSCIEYFDLNDIRRSFDSLGLNKNSEALRAIYRSIGYSIDGYWEIFYWEVNNPDWGDYEGSYELLLNDINKLKSGDDITKAIVKVLEDNIELLRYK